MLSPTLLLKQRKCLKMSLCKINFLCLKRIHFAVSSPPRNWKHWPGGHNFLQYTSGILPCPYLLPTIHWGSPWLQTSIFWVPVDKCCRILSWIRMSTDDHRGAAGRSLYSFLSSCHLKYLVGTNKACGVGLATHNQTQTQRSYYWLSERGWLILCTE